MRLQQRWRLLSAAQLTIFLRALVTIDPYAFDDVAEQVAANDGTKQQTSEEILLSTIDGLPDDKLTRFALRLVLEWPHERVVQAGIDLKTVEERINQLIRQ